MKNNENQHANTHKAVLTSPLALPIEAREAAKPIHCRTIGGCGPGPECTLTECHLPGCKDAPACKAPKEKRHAPVCAGATCSLAACAGAPLCNKVKRQVFCLPGMTDCGAGPECTTATCGLAGCKDAEACKGGEAKRELESIAMTKREPEPSPTICIITGSGQKLCGYATADAAKEKRDPKICAPYCIILEDGSSRCGCEA